MSVPQRKLISTVLFIGQLTAAAYRTFRVGNMLTWPLTICKGFRATEMVKSPAAGAEGKGEGPGMWLSRGRRAVR